MFNVKIETPAGCLPCCSPPPSCQCMYWTNTPDGPLFPFSDMPAELDVYFNGSHYDSLTLNPNFQQPGNTDPLYNGSTCQITTDVATGSDYAWFLQDRATGDFGGSACLTFSFDFPPDGTYEVRDKFNGAYSLSSPLGNTTLARAASKYVTACDGCSTLVIGGCSASWLGELPNNCYALLEAVSVGDPTAWRLTLYSPTSTCNGNPCYSSSYANKSGAQNIPTGSYGSSTVS